MKEGFYSITYAGAGGDLGFGILVFDTGAVVGADVGGVRYDGTYTYNARTQMIDAQLELTVPAGLLLVTGVPAQDDRQIDCVDNKIPHLGFSRT